MGLGDTGGDPQSSGGKFPGLPVAGSTDVWAKKSQYFTLGGCCGPGSSARIMVI